MNLAFRAFTEFRQQRLQTPTAEKITVTPRVGVRCLEPASPVREVEFKLIQLTTNDW
jgi:hypothetical protein